MKLLRLGAGLLALALISGSASAADLQQFLPGPRLIDGSQLNTVVDRVNGITGGTFAGTFSGTFKSSTYPPASSAQFLGAGTSAAPFSLGTSADQTVARLYGKGLNTTGYARSLDARMYFSGTGGEGEAVRAYGIVNNVTAAVGGTVNGIHASLQVSGASGAISGAAHAMRGTLMLDSGTTAGGTIDVAQLDTFLEGTVPTTAAFLSVANLGTNKLNYLARITSPSTTMFATAGTGGSSCGASGGAVAAKVLKVSVDGTDYWLPLCSSNS
jgi:hypothetical protein